MNDVPGGTANTGTNTSTLSAQQKHAIECALKYGGGPKAGWLTYFANNYAWSKGFDIYAQTTTNTPPPGGGWMVTKGYTVGAHPGAPFIIGQSNIFLKSNTSTKDLISTVVHEWSHQWMYFGENSEALAEQYGEKAANAYQADNGAKCGGL